ncbi:MAG: MFS transporter [Cyclobacteriaceae bacterium]|jgi:fucose permease
MYNKKLVFAAACVDILVFGVGVISLGSILPFLTEKYALDDLSKGTLASLLPLGILTGSLVFGPVVDKYSYKNLLSLSILLNILGFELIAFANSFFFLGLAFFLIGWGGGMINGATSALVSDISEDHGENKGANLSLFGIFFGVGALGMPFIISFLSTRYETDNIVAGIGSAMIAALVLNLILTFPKPKQAQSIAIKQFFQLVKNKVLLLFGFILFFQSGMEGLTNNWTTSYLIEVIRVDEQRALMSLTIYGGIFTIGRLVISLLLKVISARIVLVSSVTLALAGGIITLVAGNIIVYTAGLLCIGFGLAAGFPIVLGMVGDRFPSWTGTAFGVVFSIALIGNIIINYMTGVAAELWTIITFPIIYVISGILMLILILFSFRMARQEK